MVLKKVKRHGARMLKGLTADLYENIAMVCREYISNAVDIKANNINIEIIKPQCNSIIFADDGEGMDEKDIEEATNIMISNKTYDPDYPPIGKFGIGIYAGGKICKEIHIRTKKKEENKRRYIIIPIQRWFEEGETDLSKDITDVTIYDYDEEEINPLNEDEIQRSYTIVELHNLKSFAIDYLKNKEADLKEEIGKVAPVGYNYNALKPLNPLDYPNDLKAGIPDDVIKDKFKTWLRERVETDNHCACNLEPQYNNLRIFVNNEEIYRPVPVKDFIYPHTWKEQTFYDNDNNPIGYGWAIMRDLRVLSRGKDAQFGVYKNTNFQGINLRLWNVNVYSPVSLQQALQMRRQSATFGRWWGEIYVMDKDMKLTLNRNSISDESKNWEKLKTDMASWIRQLQSFSERKKRERKKEMFKRIEVLKIRGLSPNRNLMNDLREAVNLPPLPEPTVQPTTGEVEEPLKKEEMAETAVQPTTGEVEEPLKKEEMAELAVQPTTGEVEEPLKKEEMAEPEEDVIDNPLDYAKILIERYNLLGSSKIIIEDLGNYLDKNSISYWNDLLNSIDLMLEKYFELHKS